MTASSDKIAPSTGIPLLILAPRSYRIVWWFVALTAVLQTFYAIGFILQTSVIVEGQRYFCLFDDAMISMRYAFNWINGDGLVWNPGERVEGYTNWGWTAILALCHLPKLSPSHTCLLVQILGIPTLWGCLAGTAILARSSRLLPITAICCVAMTATYYNLIYFSLMGMETGLLCCLFAFGLNESVKCIQSNQGRLRAFLWFVPAVLIRMDALLIVVFIFGYTFLTVRNNRKKLTMGMAIVLIAMCLHAMWRYHYYGQLLPNTYYLKATGWPLTDRLVPGLVQTCRTIANYGLLLLIAAACFLPPKQWYLLLVAPFLVYLSYQTYVGGDAWPLDRFLVPTSIGIFVLTAQGIERLLSYFAKPRTRPLASGIRIGLTLIAIIAINAIHWEHYLFLQLPQTTKGNHRNIQLCRAILEATDEKATIAVGWAGAIPYFTDRQCYDLLGKCDPYIAHLPAVKGVSRAGHNKYDVPYCLSHYKPDILLHCAIDNADSNWDYYPVSINMDGDQLAFYLRKNSRHVHRGTPVTEDFARNQILEFSRE